MRLFRRRRQNDVTSDPTPIIAAAILPSLITDQDNQSDTPQNDTPDSPTSNWEPADSTFDTDSTTHDDGGSYAPYDSGSYDSGSYDSGSSYDSGGGYDGGGFSGGDGGGGF